MFDVFWMISSDNGLKNKNSGLVETRKLFKKMTKVNFYSQPVWWRHFVQVLLVNLITGLL